MKIDLDAARSARAEALEDEDNPTVQFGGETFTLPFELPFGIFLRLAEMRQANSEDPSEIDGQALLEQIRKVVHSLFGDDTDRFLDLEPSLDDLMALISALMNAYEVSLPESSASPSQS